MKFKTKGFTLAELLVAVSILAMISFFSVNTYHQMEESAAIEGSKSQILEIFRDLDDEIKNWKITSYTAHFEQNTLWTIVEIDTYGYDPIIEISSMNWSTGSGKILWNYSATGAGYKVFNNATVTQQWTLSWGQVIDFSITPFQKIDWGVRWLTEESLWNGFRPIYFEYSTSIPIDQRVKFLSFSGSTQTGGVVSNLFWKKTHTASWVLSEVFPIELNFERKWVPFSIFLK